VLSEQLFRLIKQKYGRVASWALWKDPSVLAKSNIDDLSVFDPQENPNIYQLLHTDSVMVGLNFSRPVMDSKPFVNFHDSNKHAQDYKIRYAFKNTRFYGSYMTDVIKNFECKKSDTLKREIRNQRSIVDQNLENLRQELLDIEAERPIILAFGRYTYTLLQDLGSRYYSSLICITHYSYFIGQDKYKEKAMSQIGEILSI
jgi:hypothetical protein